MRNDPLKTHLGLSPEHWKLLKWSLMICTIFWTLIFQLGTDTQTLPEFIYVNF
jgi:hypothetical protein